MNLLDKIFDQKNFEKLSLKITDNSKKCILFGILIIAFLLPGLLKVSTNFSQEVWFRKTDPFLQNFKEFKKSFGSDDMAVLAIHSKNGVFNLETVKLITEITEEIWQVPKIIRVESLTNFKWVRAEGDEIIIDDLLPQDIDEKIVKERKEIAKKLRSLKQYLISPDFKTAVIYAWPKPHYDEKPEYGPTMDGIRAIVEKYKDNKDYEFHIAGTVAMNSVLNETTIKDLLTIIPVVFLAISIMLLFIFRSAFGVFTPLLLIAITVATTTGLSGWLGIELNATTAMIPNILMAICIADSIHLVLAFVHFRQAGLDKREATLATLKKNIQPTLLTSLSTSLGFFSLMSSELMPIGQLGFLAGIGTLLAWIYSIFILTPILIYMPVRIPKKRESFKIELFNKIFNPAKASNFMSFHKVKIIIFFAIITVLAIFSASKNKIDSITIKSLKDDVPLKVAYNFMKENIGGTYGIEMVFDSGKKNGIKDPEFLRKIDAFQIWLKEAPYITKVSSIVDIIKDVNQALNENEISHYKIPNNRKTIAEEIMLYSMGLPMGMDINHWNSLDNQRIRVMIMWTLSGSTATKDEIKRIRSNLKRFGLVGDIAGTNALLAGLNDYIIDTFIKSMIMAVLLISALMSFFFRSIKLGVLSMIPNVIPPLIGAGLMTIFGISINVGTILITSVCLGIAVDDTIYFLSNYNKYIREGMSPKEAVFEIYSHTGSALIWTTVILVVGFSCFLLGSFLPNNHFGIMTAIILTLALLVDLTLLPAILLLRDRKS